MGYTYRPAKNSRGRADGGRLAKSALITLTVMAGMVGYQSTSGATTGLGSASAKTQAVASTKIVSSPATSSNPAPHISTGASGG